MIAQQRRATDVDYIDSIEDPFFKQAAQQVITTQEGNADDKDAKDRLETMEISIRKKLLELLLSLHDEGTNQGKPAELIGGFWKSCLDLCHHFVHHACSPSSPKNYENLMSCRRLPYVLLSDCLEGLPMLEDAKDFWSEYVEPELVDAVLFGDKFWSQLTENNNSKKFSLPSSHLPFLKVANQFLQRLEHSTENIARVEWKGRILWALSKGFSIADKSSMKLWGNFHTTNETDFESKEEFSKHVATEVISSTNPIEYNLYEAFWTLQSDFANPNKINVADFIKRLRLILAAMESATATSTVIHEQDDECTGIEERTTKYLTSSALLPSQIQDPTFRSSVATQFLIVASHLGAESPPLKNALSSLLGRARKLLKNDNPQLHSILWESILASGREDHWRAWKKQKCAASAFAPIKRKQQVVLDNSAQDDDRGQKRKRLATEEENDSSQEAVVSSMSSNFLNNNDLAAVSNDTQGKIPTLEEHLELYVEALDPEAGIEDEYHPKNDPLFTWRAMRLYAKHQLPLMTHCRRPADLEKITRKWYKESHGTEIPGEMPEEESDNLNGDKANGETNPADDQNDNNENDSTAMDIDAKEEIESSNVDTDMKDNETQDETENQKNIEKIDKGAEKSKEANKDEPNPKVENVEKPDGDDRKAENSNATKNESKNSQPEKEKNEKPGPKKESPKAKESTTDGKATKSKTDVADQKKTKAKNDEGSKSNTTTGNQSKQDKTAEKSQNNKNDGQRQDKRPPRENFSPPNRGGGRRGNDGGRSMQDRGRRDDGPPPRRRGDDDRPPRGGGRPGGDSSYRGRSDGPPPRGGRYDDDYRGDGRRDHSDYKGDRFNGDRSNRSTGRDDRRGGGDRDDRRGGDRGGGMGRDDHRGARPRGGGGGGRRRR